MALKAEPGENTEPTWANVAEMVAHVEGEHRCLVRIEMGKGSWGKRGLAVNVVAQRVRGRSDWYTCRYVVGSWPSSHARTMPALLVRLLWKLSDAMHDYDDLPILRSMVPEAELPRPPASD